MSDNKPIQLGLCCLNTILRAQKPPVFASRKMIIRSVEEQGIDVLKEKVLQKYPKIKTTTSKVYDYALGSNKDIPSKHLCLPIWYGLDKSTIDKVVSELKR